MYAFKKMSAAHVDVIPKEKEIWGLFDAMMYTQQETS
jgi:hypothetical protein